MIPAATSGHPRFRNSQEVAFARQELKDLIVDYKGFGILTLIRLLLFRSCRATLLAFTGIMLLVGQWVGPVGYGAAKIISTDFMWCQGDAGDWAKCLMSSVAMIYFARLTISALSHEQRLPKVFEAYNMPKWWGFYRNMDLVVTSLFYDTGIFMVNLLIVFSDAVPESMVVDVLALEFFTLIDDEFKTALLQYDDSFLDDMLLPANYEQDAAVVEPSPGARSAYSVRSSSWRPSPPMGGLTQTLFDVNEVDEAADRPPSPPLPNRESGSDWVFSTTVLWLAVLPLMILRFVCLIGGPLISFFMIGYGPYCLGMVGAGPLG